MMQNQSLYGQISPSQVRSPSKLSILMSETLNSKETTISKLESAQMTYKKYTSLHREFETKIIELKAKEQISIGMLDEKISSLLAEQNRLEECDSDMPDEQFLINQYGILKKIRDEST